MQTLRILFMSLVLGGTIISVHAQDIRTSALVWNSPSNVNQADSDTTAYSCAFKTISDQQVTWLQNNGADTTTYTINSVDGSWTNVASDGQVVYHVSSGQLTW